MNLLTVIYSIPLLLFLLILSFNYFIIKTKYAFLVYQQSAYDPKRYFRYYKTHYKQSFSSCELLPILSLFILSVNVFCGLVLLTISLYYNTRFLNISLSRYDHKLGLNVTKRVKRHIYFLAAMLIIFLLTIVIFMNMYIFLVAFFLCSYLVYPLIQLSGVILIPLESRIKNKYKISAINKLNSFDQVRVVGITGSYGKTSIKNIVYEVISQNFRTLSTPESYNTPMGLTITINKSLTNFHQVFIAEMGAYYKGEIDELCKMVSPSIGIVSSVGPQHLETFKSIENVLSTKMELIECLPQGGLGILNMDNQHIKNYKVKNKIDIKYYSLKDKSADIYGFDIEYLFGKMKFKILFKENVHLVETKLLGKHNVENILAAILVADNMNIKIDNIITSIKILKPVKNRLEFNVLNDDVAVINDAFNSNPEGIYEAVNILNSFDGYHKILITPGLIDLGTYMSEFHEKFGEDITSKIDSLFIVGNLNKNDIIKGIKKTNFTNYSTDENFIDAYNQAMKIKAKKVILIANDLPEKFND